MKLNLRDLFWMVAVAAILVAWFASHRRMVAEQAKLKDSNAELRQLAADETAKLTAVANSLVLPAPPAGPRVVHLKRKPDEVGIFRVPVDIEKGMLLDAGQATKRMQKAFAPALESDSPGR